MQEGQERDIRNDFIKQNTIEESENKSTTKKKNKI